MHPRFGWILIIWMLVVGGAVVLVYGQPTSHAGLDDRARALAAQLRCPICHGESVADSPSGIARSIRGLIRQRLAQGQSPDAITRYLVSRYGSTILLAPPSSGVGQLAWLAPLFFHLAGLALLVILIAGSRSRWKESQAGRERQGRADLPLDSLRTEPTP
jgi:cytochrome c-type biogenesis protein CcmH